MVDLPEVNLFSFAIAPKRLTVGLASHDGDACDGAFYDGASALTHLCIICP